MINYLSSKSRANLFAAVFIAVSSFVFLSDHESHASDLVASDGQSLKSLKSRNSNISATAVSPVKSSKAISVAQLLAESDTTANQPAAATYCVQNGVTQNGVQANAAANPGVCMMSRFGQIFGQKYSKAQRQNADQMAPVNGFQVNNPMAMMFRWCAMFSRPLVRSSI